MRRIIVAIDDQEPQVPQEPVSALPVEEPVSALPVAETTPTLPVAKPQKKRFVQPSGLADLISTYRQTKNGDVFEQILNFPCEGSTVQDWVAGQLIGTKTPKADATEGIWRV